MKMPISILKIILILAATNCFLYAQYGSNILTNSGAESDYTGWTKTDGTDGWATTGYQTPRNGSKCWSSSYQWCNLVQTVTLADEGYSTAWLDMAPDIFFGVYIRAHAGHQGKYEVLAQLLNASDGVITSWTSGEVTLPANSDWSLVSHTFCSYGSGVKKVRLTLRGEDGSPDWAGSYGAAFDDASVQLDESTLPGELVLFKADVVGAKVELHWRMATEVDNYGFEVERMNPPPPSGRADLNPHQGGDFELIGIVEGYGNNNSPKDYSFTDNLTLDHNLNHTLYYRLKQIDTDGSYEYSNLVKVIVGFPSEFELFQNYPNPFNPVTNIKFSIPESGLVNLTVYNILGREVVVLLNQQMKAGSYDKEFNAKELSGGMYVYSLNVVDKFTAKRKMVFLK